jgi:hypothetical protein
VEALRDIRDGNNSKCGDCQYNTKVATDVIQEVEAMPDTHPKLFAALAE